MFLTLQLLNLLLLPSSSALANLCPWPLMPFSQISLKNSELKTAHNTFRDCRVHFFRQPFSKQLYTYGILLSTKFPAAVFIVRRLSQKFKVNYALLDTSMKFATLIVVTNTSNFRYSAKPVLCRFQQKPQFIKINKKLMNLIHLNYLSQFIKTQQGT